LLEVIGSLMIIMFAVLIAGNALTALAGLSHSMSARQELFRTTEVVLESLRGGLIPLTTGPAQLTGELAPRNGLQVHSFVNVTERSPAGLYQVSVRSWADVVGRRIEVSVPTMVWMP
jgi:hypothetical protein